MRSIPNRIGTYVGVSNMRQGFHPKQPQRYATACGLRFSVPKLEHNQGNVPLNLEAGFTCFGLPVSAIDISRKSVDASADPMQRVAPVSNIPHPADSSWLEE